MPSSDLSDNTTKKDSENGALAHTLTHKECCYCFQHIHQSAKVCHHCGHHQFWFWNHFKLELIGLLISVIMVMIAAFQLNEARKERIAAKDALLKAQSTEARVLELHQLFTQHALSVISSTYLSMVTKNE